MFVLRTRIVPNFSIGELYEFDPILLTITQLWSFLWRTRPILSLS